MVTHLQIWFCLVTHHVQEIRWQIYLVWEHPVQKRYGDVYVEEKKLESSVSYTTRRLHSHIVIEQNVELVIVKQISLKSRAA